FARLRDEQVTARAERLSPHVRHERVFLAQALAAFRVKAASLDLHVKYARAIPSLETQIDAFVIDERAEGIQLVAGCKHERGGEQLLNRLSFARRLRILRELVTHAGNAF